MEQKTGENYENDKDEIHELFEKYSREHHLRDVRKYPGLPL